MAAGRYTSVLTISTFLFCFSISQRASLPALVVLPAPCRPASMTTTGRCARRLSPVLGSPMSRVSSSCTTLMKACPGVRLFVTSTPTARALTASVKLLTTRQRDIGVEQREAHLAHRIGDVVVGQPAAAGERLERRGETGGQAVEHSAVISHSLLAACASRIGAVSLSSLTRPAVILAITLFLLYIASAWVMLRSVKQPRLEPLAWVLILVAIIGHSDAIMRMMRINGPFSIGLLEAMSLLGWTLAVLACLISIDRQNRVLGRHPDGERGGRRGR